LPRDTPRTLVGVGLAGFPSKLLKVLVMALGLALVFLSGSLLLARRRTTVR